MATVQGIYVALFGRPGDPLGVKFYQENPDQLKVLQNSDEYLGRFKDANGNQLNNQAVVTKIYNDLFGRDPDTAGLEFYVARLNTGEFTISDVAIRILDGSTGSDKSIIDNKVTAADAFTAALDTPAEIAAYNGQTNPQAIPLAQDYLKVITADAASVPTADQTAAVITSIQSSANIGNSFTLTTGIDFADGDGASRNGGVTNPSGTPSDFKFTSANERVFATDATVLNVIAGLPDTLTDVSTKDQDLFAGKFSGNAGIALGIIDKIENFEFDVTGFKGGGIGFATVTAAQSVKLTGNLGAGLTLAALGATGITSVDGSGLVNKTFGLNVDLSAHPGTDALTVNGSAAGDVITTANGNDVINGGGGNDNIFAGAGNDTIDGGSANDTINGWTGDDVINGGSGNDFITGDFGNDTIDGGDGDDNISGNQGNDHLSGGAGDDIIDGGDGNDTIDGGDGNDVITGGAGSDVINGGAGNDNISGGAGGDTIDGGAGNDTIDAGAGDDTVTGGAGNDTITLGAGKDTVVFGDFGTNGSDTITDFSAADDKVDLFGTPNGAVIPNGDIGTTGFNAVGLNLVDLADNTIVTAAQIEAVVGTGATQLQLTANAVTYVSTFDGVDSFVYEVTVDGLGQGSASLIGTFNGVDLDLSHFI